jgi:hypothetical protein
MKPARKTISARSVKDLREADRLLRGAGATLAGAPPMSAFGCYQRYREVCDLVAKVLRRVTR